MKNWKFFYFKNYFLDHYLGINNDISWYFKCFKNLVTLTLRFASLPFPSPRSFSSLFAHVVNNVLLVVVVVVTHRLTIGIHSNWKLIQKNYVLLLYWVYVWINSQYNSEKAWKQFLLFIDFSNKTCEKNWSNLLIIFSKIIMIFDDYVTFVKANDAQDIKGLMFS